MKNDKIWFLLSIISLILLDSILVTNDVSYQEDFDDVREDFDFLKSSGLSNPVELEWNRTWGDFNQQFSSDIVADSNDNVYTTGTDNHGSILLLKYSSAGSLQWSTTWNAISNVHGMAIALDSIEDIYVAGFVGTPTDVILVKFNKTGDYIWHQTWGEGMSDEAFGIVIDESDSIYLTGFSESSVTMTQHLLLLKYNNSGTILWNTTWTGVDPSVGKDIELDSGGNIYVTGYTYSGILTIKFDTTGQYIWHQTWEVEHSLEGRALAIDSLDNVYVTGSRYDSLSSSSGIVLLKYDSSGNELWNRTWFYMYDSQGSGIALDSLEDVYIAGVMYSNQLGNSNYTLVKYNKQGEYLWHKVWGGDDWDDSYAITLDSNNDIYLAGYTESYDTGGMDSCLIKYTSLTQVLIYSPQQNDFFGTNSPHFDISILDMEPNNTWYSLDNGVHNFIFTGLSGTINQTEWNKFGQGNVDITFYANNSAGYIGYSAISVKKDLTPPVSSINYIPYDEISVVNSSTLFTITTDDGLGAGVEKIQYQINFGDWIDYSNPFNLYNYETQDHIISFRAIDIVGNVEDTQTIVVHLIDTRVSPSSISGYALIALIGVTIALSAIIMKKNARKAKIT